jgi:hypothetical protein
VHRPARGFPRSKDIIQIRHQLGLRIYQASHDDYRKSVLPSGYPAGTPQEALDCACACGLYLGDTTARLDPHMRPYLRCRQPGAV